MIDCRGEGGTEKQPRAEQDVLTLLGWRHSERRELCQGQKLGPPGGARALARATSGAETAEEGARAEQKERRWGCCGSRDGIEIPRSLPFSDSPVVRQPSLGPTLPGRLGSHTTPMQETITGDNCRLLKKERRARRRIPESHAIFLLPRG